MKNIFGRKASNNPHVQTGYDLLVIEPNYFSKPVKGRANTNRYAFMVARRENGFKDEWKIEFQSYDRTDYGISSSSGNYTHGPYSTVSSVEEVQAAFDKFRKECLVDGMKECTREEATYLYGLPLDRAVKLLDIAP